MRSIIYINKDKGIKYTDRYNEQIYLGDILEIETHLCEIPYYAEVMFGKYYYTNYYRPDICNKLKGDGYYLKSLNDWLLGCEDIKDTNKNLITKYTDRTWSPNFSPREPFPLQRIINNLNIRLLELRKIDYEGSVYIEKET
jgi:hypothetical protein